ncbi:MAG: Ppx/GppA family phosphatase [Paracoccaceae bacterium]
MNKKTDTLADDSAFFGQSLFDDPSARALERVGVVDVGSNSVRMVIFDGAARSPSYFFNEKIMAGLGRDTAETGRLNPEGRQRALQALKRFASLARSMGLRPLACVATAAVRDAADGAEFCEEVRRQTGLDLQVIDGLEEARLSAQGVLLGWPEAQGLVCDIGGNSMELAEIKENSVGRRVTSPLGPFRLQRLTGGKRAIEKYIREVMEDLAARMGTDHDRIYLVGGSWRAIARLDMERQSYPMTVLHEYRMTPEAVLKTVDWIAKSDLAALRARTGTSQARMDLVPMASLVLKQLLQTFKPVEIDVSSYGIREGMLYEQMPERLRRRDPLIEACRYAELQMARMPGFGKKLYQFLIPLFEDASPARLRMIKAACLLHDTTWRAHPDYRAEVCFDNATRANLGGLSHQERVFLGLALLHRYKNSRAGSRLSPLFALLSDQEIAEAEILGKAMRFGAMLSAHSPEKTGHLHLDKAAGTLTFSLRPGRADLFGEVAAARFNALADALKVTAVVDGGSLSAKVGA